MYKQNILNPIIEESVFKTVNNDCKLTSSNYYEYGLTKKMYKPISVYRIKDNTSTTDCVIDNNLNINPNYIKLFDYQYDIKGNVIESKRKDDFYTTYLWSYNYQHLIAEIKNASYLDVEKQLGGESTIKLLSENLNPVMTDIDALRSKLPSALITTYTYIPLVGMTSVKDPRGVVTNYNYDDFGRLMNVKDKDNKAIKVFEYHYK
jgi:YD repeat-containing protein